MTQVVSGLTEPLESHLRRQFVDIVRDSQSELSRSYRQTVKPQAMPYPSRENSDRGNGQLDFSTDRELAPLFDFSALCTPPHISESHPIPNGTNLPSSLVGSYAGTSQPMSDSGYGSTLHFSCTELGQSGLEVDEYFQSSVGETERQGALLATEESYSDQIGWVDDLCLPENRGEASTS